MIEKEIDFRKKREFGDILSDSFDFLKQEYQPIFKLVLTYVLPFLILYAIVQVKVQMKLSGVIDFANTESIMENIGPFYMNLFLYSLFGVFVQSLFMGTYYSYLEVYVEKGKGNFTLADITPLLFSNGMYALLVNLIVFVVVVFGFIFCFIPGIYFANIFSLAVAILIFEKKGIGDSLWKSRNLVSTQWWNTFLINIVGILLVMVFGFVISLPITISGMSNSIFNLGEMATMEQPMWYWVAFGVTSVISTILYVIPYTFIAMQYFNLEERIKPQVPEHFQ